MVPILSRWWRFVHLPVVVEVEEVVCQSPVPNHVIGRLPHSPRRLSRRKVRRVREELLAIRGVHGPSPNKSAHRWSRAPANV